MRLDPAPGHVQASRSRRRPLTRADTDGDTPPVGSGPTGPDFHPVWPPARACSRIETVPEATRELEPLAIEPDDLADPIPGSGNRNLR